MQAAREAKQNPYQPCQADESGRDATGETPPKGPYGADGVDGVDTLPSRPDNPPRCNPAGQALPCQEPDGSARVRAALELCLLFFGVPLLFFLAPGTLPKRPALIAALAYVLVRLYFRVGRARWREVWRAAFSPPQPGWWRGLCLRAPLVAVVCIVLVHALSPDSAFFLVRERPAFWLAIMVLYPLLSVLPQEIIYRLYFFEAYRGLFPSERWLALLNIALFSWLHVFYTGFFAMGATLLAGAVFTTRYLRGGPPDRRSLWPVLIEHALYGQILFTAGMGRYFYVTM